MEKISIIIPVYNTADLIEKCVESVRRQTYKNLEIICVDDGSEDGSGEVLDRMAKIDSRILVFHQKNFGESRARNVGLSKSTGDYIGFLDCDDWIEPEMYECLVKAMREYDADMAASGWYKDWGGKNEKIKIIGIVEKGVFGRNQLLHYIYERDRHKEFAYIWNKIYKREILQRENREFIWFSEDLILGGDVLYLAEVALNVSKAVFVNRTFYHYFQREDSGGHSRDFAARKGHLIAYLRIIELFGDENVPEDIMVWVKRFLAYQSSVIGRVAYEQKDEKGLLFCQELMKRYEKEYVSTNQEYPERILEFNKILQYNMGKRSRKNLNNSR